MSDNNWSTEAQNGSMKSGFGGADRQEGNEGIAGFEGLEGLEGLEGFGTFEEDRASSFESDNVILAAVTSSATVDERAQQRRAGLQAQVDALAGAALASMQVLPAEQGQTQDGEEQKMLEHLVFATGMQFDQHTQ